ncbi:MAG: VanZ family protein [Saccharofermentanales bacterium]
MAITKKQILVKIITILPASVLGILFNFIVTTNISRNLVGAGLAQSIIMLIGQILVFYSLLQLIIFRGRFWSRAELVIVFIAYIAVLFVGLIFRFTRSFELNHFVYWFSLEQIELNPFSFISNFQDDHSSIIIAIINFILFIPLPALMYLNQIKPRFRVALILFFFIELLQPTLSQGFFSLGDITLYSAGFLIGMLFLKKEKIKLWKLKSSI